MDIFINLIIPENLKTVFTTPKPQGPFVIFGEIAENSFVYSF